MTELARITSELTHEQQVAKTKELGRVILSASAELEAMPREAIIEAAGDGIAHYHRESAIWGFKHSAVMAIEKEKEFRMSLLTDEERKVAIVMANDWLDSNFDQ